MLVAGQDVSVSGMLIQNPRRLVEDDLWEATAIDRCRHSRVVLQMFVTIGRSRREAREIIERMMMGDEIRRAVGAGRDDLARRARRLHAILDGGVPGARVPHPRDALRRKRVADRLELRGWQRVLCRICKASVTILRRLDA